MAEVQDAVQPAITGTRPEAASATVDTARAYSVWVRAAASPVMPAAAPLDELALAQRRIAELERKIGQQQVDLDFFQRALRHVREARRLTGAAGASVSTRSSKR